MSSVLQKHNAVHDFIRQRPLSCTDNSRPALSVLTPAPGTAVCVQGTRMVLAGCNVCELVAATDVDWPWRVLPRAVAKPTLVTCM